jgi:hypothetical protein
MHTSAGWPILAECPILAVFARVGVFEPFTLTFPFVAKSPPFENYKGWGTRTERPNQFLGVEVSEWYNPTTRIPE